MTVRHLSPRGAPVNQPTTVACCACIPPVAAVARLDFHPKFLIQLWHCPQRRDRKSAAVGRHSPWWLRSNVCVWRGYREFEFWLVGQCTGPL